MKLRWKKDHYEPDERKGILWHIVVTVLVALAFAVAVYDIARRKW